MTKLKFIHFRVEVQLFTYKKKKSKFIYLGKLQKSPLKYGDSRNYILKLVRPLNF